MATYKGYRYGWDSNNKKKVYMGKYSKVTARGYYGKNDAGDKPEFKPKDWGTDVGFVGSGSREYIFYSETRGMLTVMADSFEEAWRIAKLRGYSRKNYRSK